MYSGQGGRPETGFNRCLHSRYTRIARSLGCTSYWIDVTCIPDDHRVRRDAIRRINETFAEAKVMLVCDKDIMQIDVSEMTTSVCETVLVTAIVSDWNTRAWTFFEAFRARRTIHLLCKNNVVVSLKQIIQKIHSQGTLDIGVLLLAVPHFLPPADDFEMAQPKAGIDSGFHAGYLTIQTSGSLLSHRPASRPGDDIVIWSLLINEKTIVDSAEAFWKSMQRPVHETSTSLSGGFARGKEDSYKLSRFECTEAQKKGIGMGTCITNIILHLSVR